MVYVIRKGEEKSRLKQHDFDKEMEIVTLLIH